MTEVVTITEEATKQGISRIKFTFEAAADGTATGETNGAYTGLVSYVTSDPDGTTAPTAAWDFQVQDDDNYDVLNGAGTDRSATATEYLSYPSDGLGTVFDSKLTLEVSGAGSGGKGVVVVTIV